MFAFSHCNMVNASETARYTTEEVCEIPTGCPFVDGKCVGCVTKETHGPAPIINHNTTNNYNKTEVHNHNYTKETIIKETVKEIRKFSDRPILIRSHRHAGETQQLKEDKKNLDYIMNNYKDITHTRLGETSIYDDLKNAWACVVYTSTSGAVAMLEGIPMFSTHEACFSHQWSAGKLSEIENPCLNNRENFITHYANAHWNLDEVRKGYYWEKYAAS